MSLALVAGYVDGYGLLTLGTFVSFMSGNSTTAGLSLGHGAVAAALSPLVAIGGFVAGSFAGTLLAHARLPRPRRTLFSLVLVCLLAAVAIGDAERPAAMAALSLGMGMVNPALSHVGTESISLTFVTGTLSRIGAYAALHFSGKAAPGAEGAWDTPLRRCGLSALMWAAFVVGAVLAGALLERVRGIGLLPPATLLFVLSRLPEPETG